MLFEERDERHGMDSSNATLAQLEDEIRYLSVAQHVHPQDAERIYSLLDAVEKAYPTTALPANWSKFTRNVEQACEGTRTRPLLNTIKSQYDELEFESPPKP